METEELLQGNNDWNDCVDSEEDYEVTYESICLAVKEDKKRSDIKNMLSDYKLQQYTNMNTLDTITDDLWYNVIVPYIENNGGILDKHQNEIRHAFSVWLYENTNWGQKIAYIAKLEKALNIPN